jgi:uncharacterized phage protein (TIGR01671 family)
MREILFRGKRKDNGKWAYGFYALFARIHTGAENGCVIPYEVDPETVGQFTGLTDKNGKKIFEGDIVKIISIVKGEMIGNTRTFKSEEREDCAVVLLDYKTGGYKLKVYHKGKYKRISKFTIAHLWGYEAEVIGNIHDNPELLEEL